MVALAILGAVCLDWLLGDPYDWPHPVKAIGHMIYFLLRFQPQKKIWKYCYGGILWLFVVGCTSLVTCLLLQLGQVLHPVCYWLIWVYLAYASLATRSLAVEAVKVYRTLSAGTLDEARKQVGMIVGRETASLSKEEIAKATIETVAENTSDGVIGPLLCLAVGGPVLAMAYKAINTLDSMVGYKTAKYKEIGFVSAKIDDLANLIPARVTFLCLIIASHILQLQTKEAWRIGWRDRYQHASPNSAFSEAVVAGALGLQLGGTHLYHGEVVSKPTIGEAKREVRPEDILTTVNLLYMSTFVATAVILISYLSFILSQR